LVLRHQVADILRRRLADPGIDLCVCTDAAVEHGNPQIAIDRPRTQKKQESSRPARLPLAKSRSTLLDTVAFARCLRGQRRHSTERKIPPFRWNRHMPHTSQVNLHSSLSVEFNDDIAVLRLSRSEKRNAFDDSMIRGLHRLFSELRASIRAAGAGYHFSAGSDLSSIHRYQSLLRPF
jgi:hypothetical protein